MYPQKIVSEIMEMDAEQVEYILDAAIKRRRVLNPEWEIFYCAAKKGEFACVEELLGRAVEFEQKLRRELNK